MKITIDTKEDSHDEIRNIINMLSSLIGASRSIAEDNVNAGESENSEPEPLIGEGIFGMFTNNRQEPASVRELDTPGNEVSGMLTEHKEQEVNLPEPEVVYLRRDEPRIIPY
ncbi:hypothetical protein HYX10_01215 [Candidatus Woesearchaeota archaeon]|nr:hypothetical protein [Candidatus Woesearchaeota archaeon]